MTNSIQLDCDQSTIDVIKSQDSDTIVVTITDDVTSHEAYTLDKDHVRIEGYSGDEYAYANSLMEKFSYTYRRAIVVGTAIEDAVSTFFDTDESQRRIIPSTKDWNCHWEVFAQPGSPLSVTLTIESVSINIPIILNEHGIPVLSDTTEKKVKSWFKFVSDEYQVASMEAMALIIIPLIKIDARIEHDRISSIMSELDNMIDKYVNRNNKHLH